VTRDLGQKGIVGLHGRQQFSLDPSEVGLENRELKQRARSGHTATIGAPSRNAPTDKFAFRDPRDWPM
jgi:hypothetical protein